MDVSREIMNAMAVGEAPHDEEVDRGKGVVLTNHL